MRRIFVLGVLRGTTNKRPSDLKRLKTFVKVIGNDFFFSALPAGITPLAPNTLLLAA